MKRDPSGYWKSIGIKGGPGSGSWNGPGDPRFAGGSGGKEEGPVRAGQGKGDLIGKESEKMDAQSRRNYAEEWNGRFNGDIFDGNRDHTQFTISTQDSYKDVKETFNNVREGWNQSKRAGDVADATFTKGHWKVDLTRDSVSDNRGGRIKWVNIKLSYRDSKWR